MLDVLELARSEESRLGLGIGEVARERMPIAGGWAARDVPGTWANSSAGLGLDGPVEREEIQRLAAWYISAGIEPRVEVCPLADPSLLHALALEGFVAREFEQLLYLELAGGEAITPPRAPPEGLVIEIVDPTDDRAVLEAATTIDSGFAAPMRPVLERNVSLAMRCLRHHRSTTVVAKLDGRAVGAGSMETHGHLAALYGLSVAPEHRRRGLQQAMIAFRLALARERGCTLATITGVPGGGTERNVRRFGFEVAYTRAIFVKPGPGLVSVGALAAESAQA